MAIILDAALSSSHVIYSVFLCQLHTCEGVLIYFVFLLTIKKNNMH